MRVGERGGAPTCPELIGRCLSFGMEGLWQALNALSTAAVAPPLRTVETFEEVIAHFNELPSWDVGLKRNFHQLLVQKGIPASRSVELVRGMCNPVEQDLTFTCTKESLLGSRLGTNEDRSFIIEDDQYLMAGVCDGHGDPEAKVAEYVSTNFPNILKECLTNEEDVKEALSRACKEMEEAVCKYQRENFSTWSSVADFVNHENDHLTLMLGGTTMSMLLVVKETKKAYVCSLGDSEVRMGLRNTDGSYNMVPCNQVQNWTQKEDAERARSWLRDHGAEEVLVFNNYAFGSGDVEEFDNFLRRGAISDLRVRGANFSGSFGDKGYTAKGELKAAQPISTTPFVAQVPLTPSRIIIGSDGYFDFVPDAQTEELLRSHATVSEIANRALENQKETAKSIVSRGQSMTEEERADCLNNDGDNITVIQVVVS